jgi:hypothetical protein
MVLLVKAFWRTTVFFGTWLGILFFAKDVGELPEAIKSWGPLVPSQENLLIVFSGALVVWVFWTDVRPFVKNSRIVLALSGLRTDPPDVLAAKKQLADFVVDHLAPCSHSIYETLRIASHVYKPANATGDTAFLVSLGIMARFDGYFKVADLLDKDKIRNWQLDAIESQLVSTTSKYLSQAMVLNTICHEIIRAGRYTDDRKYTQKDSKNFISLVKDWSSKHKGLEDSLLGITQGSNFSKLKYYVQERRMLATNFNGKWIGEFIEKHDDLIAKKGEFKSPALGSKRT